MLCSAGMAAQMRGLLGEVIQPEMWCAGKMVALLMSHGDWEASCSTVLKFPTERQKLHKSRQTWQHTDQAGNNCECHAALARYTFTLMQPACDSSVGTITASLNAKTGLRATLQRLYNKESCVSSLAMRVQPQQVWRTT